MKELVCIVCPIGCSLQVNEDIAAIDGGDGLPALTISGNRCPRGAAYAQEELRAPKRVVTATCTIYSESARSLHAPRRVPVKTNAPCPKEKIPTLLADIYKTTVSLPVKAGDTVIVNWQDSGFDVIATRTIA